jgi:DNA polymerase-1
MVRVNNALKRESLKAKLVLQIHHELLLDVPLDEVEKVKEVVHHEMTNAWDLGIPLEVEIGTGATWLEAH